MNRNNRWSGLLLPALFLAALVGGCDNRQEQAQAAYAEYQAALVGGDLRAARQALIALVAADDSNAQYWIELGKISLELADYGGAYDAYLRAHELDRANVEGLTVLTQIALRSGNLDMADQHARQLEILAPTNPAVPLTKGYIALRRSDFEEASRQAAAFTQVSPYDSAGTVLRSRILVAQNKPEEAITLLAEQVKQVPSDATSLRALAAIYELREQWSDAATTLRNYLGWQPKDAQARVRLVEAELRSGQVAAAADVTVKAVAEDDIDNLLGPWVALGQQEVIADRLFAWAKSTSTGRRIAIARFLTTAEKPERVLALIEQDAVLPVRPDNVIPNALYGAALVQSGRAAEGSVRLDQVIAVDGANREALRARALLRSRTGKHQEAIEDAQKLVATDNSSPLARVFLARIYQAGGDTDGARRTLWDGFHDIGGDRLIYDALRPLVARLDGAQAAQRLSQEFYDKRNDQLTRSIA